MKRRLDFNEEPQAREVKKKADVEKVHHMGHKLATTTAHFTLIAPKPAALSRTPVDSLSVTAPAPASLCGPGGEPAGGLLPAPAVPATVRLATPAAASCGVPQTPAAPVPLPHVTFQPATQLTLSTSDCNAAMSVVLARSSAYKTIKKLRQNPEYISRVRNLPTCCLCGQVTQGHRRHKRKVFCHITGKSSSKGLKDKVFASFEEFEKYVDNM